MSEIEHELALDAAGDLDLRDGRLRLIKGPEALIQRLRCRLRIFRGDWFLDDTWGLPWFQSILGRSRGLVAVRSVLRQAVLTTPGVASVGAMKLNHDRQRRRLSVLAQVQHDAGGQAELQAEVG